MTETAVFVEKHQSAKPLLHGHGQYGLIMLAHGTCVSLSEPLNVDGGMERM